VKSSEILLAAAVVGGVSGALGAFLVQSFGSGGEPVARQASVTNAEPGDGGSSGADSELGHSLDDLRMGDVALATRIDELEARLALVATRAPASLGGELDGRLSASEVSPERLASMLGDGTNSPEFVATVGRALEEIRAQEEAEREAARQEMMRQRIEDRVARLQESLGLSNVQTRDMRTVLLDQESKRDELFASMRDGQGDPMSMRESMRTLRDETSTALQGILTADQYQTYRETERDDFRGGFGGDFGRGNRGGGGTGGGGEDRGRRGGR
jgi:hypothetical protein